MRNDAVFVLLDLSCHLEQLENNADGLSRCEFRVLERLGTQLLVQHIGSTMQDEPHAVKYHRQSRWLEMVSASKAPINP